jgi:hypothetical protein
MSEDDGKIELDSFETELAELEACKVELKDLYTVSRKQLEDIRKKANKTRGGLAFIHLQTGNLATIQNAIMQNIKGRIDIKNKNVLMRLKVDEADNNSGAGDIPFELMQLIMDKFTADNGSGIKQLNQLDDEKVDDIIEAELTTLLEGGELPDDLKDHLTALDDDEEEDAEFVDLDMIDLDDEED